ncbi:MAG: ACS family MFS transporter [Gammaproteobacteria bacterium]|nr:ACS family MFS transporter [Gammaproteobacteria bacterium]
MPQRHKIVGLCFLASVICYLDRVNISVAVIPMQQQFGWSDSMKGLVLSSFFAGYMIMQIPSGWLANRVGGVAVLGAAVIWWSLFTVLTPAAALVSVPVLILARVALGLGEAATYPAAYRLFGRWVPERERSRSVALLLSGVPLGTLGALLSSGWLVANYGWPSVFYAFGILGIVWAAAWFRVARDAPAPHASPSGAGQELLPRSGGSLGRGSDPIPWRLLFTSPAVWALIVNHFCSNWVLYILLTWLPSYFHDTQGVSVTGAGIYSAAPWLIMFVMVNAAGWCADRLCAGGMSLTSVRKIMQCIGLLGSAAALLGARDAQTLHAAVFYMCSALGFLACTWSGWAPNHLDIAPRYADVLIGISNTFGTLPGVIGVAVAGWLVDVTGGYTAIFALVALMNLIGAAVWVAFASGERVVD